LRADLYLMDADGANPARLKFFNERGHPHAEPGGATVTSHRWSRDGRRIISKHRSTAHSETCAGLGSRHSSLPERVGMQKEATNERPTTSHPAHRGSRSSSASSRCSARALRPSPWPHVLHRRASTSRA
jgi:hypothetical protein